ncbi:hypothetical protein T4C_12391 [Trichinella pseudospiralis]|uniref:Uncharacterized protein n=1 Tax=Trichinella pseudospiralis TaxID=6337 RepID=A0A0V1IDW7_TRIPS|nr:hypothetical protein T4C_12391 [Trichinella pseudospiralis]
MFIPFSNVIINPNATFEGHFLNTEDKSNAKSASFTIAAVAFASSVFNREHYRRERHLLKLMDPVRGLNTNLCFITSTMTAIPINADPKIDIYNP